MIAVSLSDPQQSFRNPLRAVFTKRLGQNPAGAINDFGKDFVTHWFSSVVNTPSMTPELPSITCNTMFKLTQPQNA